MALVKILKIGEDVGWKPSEMLPPILNIDGSVKEMGRPLQAGDITDFTNPQRLIEAGYVVLVDEKGQEVDPVSNEFTYETDKGEAKKGALTVAFEKLDKAFKKRAGVNKRVHANEDQLRELKRLWTEHAESEMQTAVDNLTKATVLHLIARSEGKVSTKKRHMWIREMNELFQRIVREKIRQVAYTETELTLERLQRDSV